MNMCAQCFSYRPQDGQWKLAEGQLFCSEECARTHLQWDARHAMMATCPVQPGDRVRRVRGSQPTLGTVKALYTVPHTTRTAHTYRLQVRVQWDNGNRRLNGRSDIHSDLHAEAVVKVTP